MFVWLSVCLLGFIVVCLFVCLLNNPLALPLATLAHPSRPALPSDPGPDPDPNENNFLSLAVFAAFIYLFEFLEIFPFDFPYNIIRFCRI